MSDFIRIRPESRIDGDRADYFVIASSKSDPSDPYSDYFDPYRAYQGTYEECALFVERNASEDNSEAYAIYGARL